MSFLIRCGGCSQNFSVPDGLAGSNVACPKCGAGKKAHVPPRDELSGNDDCTHPILWALIGGVVVVLAVATFPHAREEVNVPLADEPGRAARVTEPDEPAADLTISPISEALLPIPDGPSVNSQQPKKFGEIGGARYC